MNVLFIAPIGLNTSVEGFQAVHGGYGNATFNTLKILHYLKEENKINFLSVIDISKPKISKEVTDSLAYDYDVCICVSNPAQLSGDKAFLSFVKKYMKLAKKRYLQIVWETENFPKSFNNLFEDKDFTGFLAPSYWGCKELKKVTDKPIFYYPHFADASNFNLIDINKKEKETKFTVLYLGQYTKRKGVDEALISFVRALGNKEDCEIILKISMMSSKEIEPELYLRSLINLNTITFSAGVKFLNENLSNEDLGRLYDSSSVLLFPSRGEGFGLPIAEAMLQGLPIIYTGWSAIKEVGKSDYNLSTKYMVDEAYSMSPYKYESGLKYAVPEIYDIMEKLKFLYEEWKQDKKKYYEKYSNNRKVIDDRYGLQASKDVIMNILNDGEKFAEEKKIVTFNSNTEFLDLEKFAEVGKDIEGYKWIMRKDSFYNDILQDEVGANIEHEIQILKEVRKLYKEGDVFIDIGSHVGYYSIRLAKHFKEVYSVEPNTNNYQALCLNAILNELTNIKCIPLLLHSEKKSFNLVDKGSSSHIIDKIKEGERIYSVVSDTFDNLFYGVVKNNNCIIKIDVEGAELEVLRGAIESLKENNNKWLIEYHNKPEPKNSLDEEEIETLDQDDGWDMRNNVIVFMGDFGYTIYKEFEDEEKIIFEKK